MLNKPFVLSGGGCRAFAHLGVVKALQEHGIYPSAIAGTSAGALAGAFLANSFTPDEIMDMLTDKLNLKMFAWNKFEMGLISLKKIKEFLQNNLPHKEFEELPIPFYITATNFSNGKQTIFSKGDMIDALVAACSIPGVFPPVFMDNIPYVDGGLCNNLPIEPFIDKKSEIVGIYVNPIKLFKPNETVIEVMDRALHLALHQMVNQSGTGCFLYIEPPELNKFGIFDFRKTEDIFEIGYNFTKELLHKTGVTMS